MQPEHFVTLNSALIAVNTILVIAAGFLFRDAWTNVHERIDRLEEKDSELICRMGKVEGVLYGMHRRSGDSPSEAT